jgi:hypothetical protein
MNHRDIDLRIIESGILIARTGPYLLDVPLDIHMMPIRAQTGKVRITQVGDG